MNFACRDFRRELELCLEGRPDPARLTPLGWNEHLLGCAECRELLASEQALEELLATLPEPSLPHALARKVLERLRREREGSVSKLDELLEASPQPSVPAGLSARVLAAARAEAETDPLDRLLEQLPEPTVPAGLAAGVLEATRAADRRAPLQPAPRPRRAFQVASFVLAAAAALLAFFLLVRGDDPAAPGGVERVARTDTSRPAPVDDELTDDLVEAFEVLDNWDYLDGEDLDLLLASIDELDQLVLEENAWSEALESETDLDAGTANEERGG